MRRIISSLMLQTILVFLLCVSQLTPAFAEAEFNLIHKTDIYDFIGSYKVTDYRVVKNNEDVVDETMRLTKIELSQEEAATESFVLNLFMPRGGHTRWKMKTADETLGDEEMGLEGVRMRLDAFDNGVGWRKIAYSLVGKTQFRIVDTFTFEKSKENLIFRQHRVRYNYPTGTTKNVLRDSTEEYIYTLKKI